MNRSYYYTLLNKGGTGGAPPPQTLQCYLTDFSFYNDTSIGTGTEFFAPVSCNTGGSGIFDFVTSPPANTGYSYTDRYRGIAFAFNWTPQLGHGHDVTVEYSTNGGASYTPNHTFTAVANATYGYTLSLGTWVGAIIRFRITAII